MLDVLEHMAGLVEGKSHSLSTGELELDRPRQAEPQAFNIPRPLCFNAVTGLFLGLVEDVVDGLDHKLSAGQGRWLETGHFRRYVGPRVLGPPLWCPWLIPIHDHKGR